MRQEDYSPKQTAAMKARVKRMRAQYRRRLIAAIIIFFILGAVAGVFAHRWYAEKTPDTTGVSPRMTPDPTAVEVTLAPEETPEAWAMEDSQPSEEGDIFPEDDDQADSGAELDAFPEVDSQQLTDDAGTSEEAREGSGLLIAPGDKPESQGESGDADAEDQQPEAEAATEAEPNAAPEAEAATEAEPNAAPEAEAATEAEPDAAPEAEAATEAEPNAAPEAEAPAETEPNAAPEAEAPAEAEPDAAPEAEDAQAALNAPNTIDAQAVPEDGAQTPQENPAEAPAESADAPAAEQQPQNSGYGPQVVAIVPYGESFTYTTEINAEGNARVEATNAPYETVCFTQTMRNYMRPTDYADKYATQYKMQGNEAGASFELTLLDYTGNATIIPQNVIDVSLRSESGDTVEHGYQLMDAEIDGKYGIALPTNTPKTFYKRFDYPASGEDMKYLVITTYKNGQTQMILFELENEKPEVDTTVIYPVLQRGLANDDVLNLQKRLAELGYFNATPEGTFGPKTEEAIKAAQAAFGMEPNGIADNAFQQKLYEGAPPSANQATGFVTLKEGSTGEAVVRLQKRLAELGYYSGRADGGYGPIMAAAVRKAQVDFGMEQTGIADSEFQQRAFAEAADAEGGTGYTLLQKGSKGEAVVRLQLSLREQGYYSGKADGGYGPLMVEAVKKAQAAFGMEQTGIADVAFQQRLFGSVTAPAEEPAESADENAAN